MRSSADDDDNGHETSSRTLNDTVYAGWKLRTVEALDRKQVGLYVDGEIPCPAAWSGAASDVTGAAAAKEKILQWKTKDRMAKAIISSRLPHDHLHLASAAGTSKELWEAILHKYEDRRSGAAVAATLQDVLGRKWDPDSGTLEQHIAWFRSTNELLAKFDPGTQLAGSASTGAAIQEHLLSMILCKSIPSTDEWGSVKATIFASNLFRFEEVAARLMGEWHRLQMDEKDRRSAIAAAAYYTGVQPSRGNSSPSDKRKDDRPVCSHCDKRGHRKEKCWQLHPDLAPDGVKERRQQSKKDGKKDGKKAAHAQHHSSSDDESSDGDWASCAVLVEEDEDDSSASKLASAVTALASAPALASASMRASKSDDEAVSVHSAGIKGKSLMTDWLVDSGATLHCCCEREMFDTLEPMRGKGRSVTLGDGRRVPVAGCGTLKVNVSVLGRLSAGTLRNVQYTPDMAVNLLSVPSLTSAGLEVLFGDRDCTIRRGRKVVARARKVANKLFQLTVVKRAEPAALSVKSDQAVPDRRALPACVSPTRRRWPEPMTDDKKAQPANGTAPSPILALPRRTSATYLDALTKGLPPLKHRQCTAILGIGA